MVVWRWDHPGINVGPWVHCSLRQEIAVVFTFCPFSPGMTVTPVLSPMILPGGPGGPGSPTPGDPGGPGLPGNPGRP